MDVNRSNGKLFRAIVIMGAAMTASACFDESCPKCVRGDARVDSRVVADSTTVSDAAVDAPQSPTDGAPMDVVLII